MINLSEINSAVTRNLATPTTNAITGVPSDAEMKSATKGLSSSQSQYLRERLKGVDLHSISQNDLGQLGRDLKDHGVIGEDAFNAIVGTYDKVGVDGKGIDMDKPFDFLSKMSNDTKNSNEFVRGGAYYAKEANRSQNIANNAMHAFQLLAQGGQAASVNETA